MDYPVKKTDAQWQALLASKGAEPAAFEVTRRQFAVQWGEIQTEIEKEIKRRESA